MSTGAGWSLIAVRLHGEMPDALGLEAGHPEIVIARANVLVLSATADAVTVTVTVTVTALAPTRTEVVLSRPVSTI